MLFLESNLKMKRLFNKKQKLALELYANGKCSICGCVLPHNFHADHIKPYSKNGKTDVINGQALCPICNLEKGNKYETSQLATRRT